MMGRLRQAAGLLFRIDDTPHRIALSFGIGVWIAFCPLWGVHTLIALTVAFSFRLSRAAMLVGAYVNNPWTMVPMYASGTLVGCALLGVSTEGLGGFDWDLSGIEFYQALFESLRPYLWPFLLGNTLLGIVAGWVAYTALRSLLERRRLRAAGAAASPS